MTKAEKIVKNIKKKVAAFSAKDKATILSMVKDKTRITSKRTGKLIGGQDAIAQTLGTRKENIAYFLKTKKIGRRAPAQNIVKKMWDTGAYDEYSDAMKAYAKTSGARRKRAEKAPKRVYQRKKGSTEFFLKDGKRVLIKNTRFSAGRKYKDEEERYETMREKRKRWKALKKAGKDTSAIDTEIRKEAEEYLYGDSG